MPVSMLWFTVLISFGVFRFKNAAGTTASSVIDSQGRAAVPAVPSPGWSTAKRLKKVLGLGKWVHLASKYDRKTVVV